MTWEDEALCTQVDPDLFFPTEGREHVTMAKRMCNRCPVRAECLEAALADGHKFGIWGGYTTKERDQLRRLAS